MGEEASVVVHHWLELAEVTNTIAEVLLELAESQVTRRVVGTVDHVKAHAAKFRDWTAVVTGGLERSGAQ